MELRTLTTQEGTSHPGTDDALLLPGDAPPLSGLAGSSGVAAETPIDVGQHGTD